MTENLNRCKVCNVQFDSEEKLREHERAAHDSGKKPGERTGKQDSGERVAS